MNAEEMGTPGAAPPEAEWNFGKTLNDLAPGEWVLLTHYEAGRTYRPLVEEVFRLRETEPAAREVGTYPPATTAIAAARFFARYYPEFPSKPYSAIPPAIRRRRLETIGISWEDNPYSVAAVHVHDPGIFCWQIATGELSLNLVPGLEERLMILEIDPSCGRKMLDRALKQRLTAKLKQLSQFKNKPPGLSPGLRARQQVGKGRNLQVVSTFMKALGALRLMAEASWDWQRAADLAAGSARGYVPYKRVQISWDRPYKYALCLLKRFQIAWKEHFFPEFILDPTSFDPHWRPLLAKPLPSQDEAVSQARPFEGRLRPLVLGPSELHKLIRED